MVLIEVLVHLARLALVRKLLILVIEFMMWRPTRRGDVTQKSSGCAARSRLAKRAIKKLDLGPYMLTT